MHRQTILLNQIRHSQCKSWCESSNTEVKVLNNLIYTIFLHKNELCNYYHEKTILF